jgi:hypothetical protein
MRPLLVDHCDSLEGLGAWGVSFIAGLRGEPLPSNAARDGHGSPGECFWRDRGGGESRMRDTRRVSRVGSILHSEPIARRRTR